MISVVIPALNEEKYLGDCLESLVRQDYEKKYEIIVVDNNSVDRTRDIARDYSCKIVNEKKMGVAFARQIGVVKSKGDIIAFTDADCVVSKNWLSEIESSFKPAVVSVIGPAVSQNPFKLSYSMKLITKTYNFGSNFLVKTFNLPWLHGFNAAVDKSKFFAAGGFNTKLKTNSDIELGLRLSKYGRFVYNPRMISYFSLRRLEKYGLVKFLQFYLKNTWDMFFGNNQTNELEQCR